jgi:competence/damage-inducible protein CinA-like protein
MKRNIVKLKMEILFGSNNYYTINISDCENNIEIGFDTEEKRLEMEEVPGNFVYDLLNRNLYQFKKLLHNKRPNTYYPGFVLEFSIWDRKDTVAFNDRSNIIVVDKRNGRDLIYVAEKAREDICAIYIDGSFNDEKNKGAYCVIINHKDGSCEQFDDKSHVIGSSQMELAGAIEGLKKVVDEREVRIITDSQYVRKGLTEWIINWKLNGWHTANGTKVKNIELWQEFASLTDNRYIEFEWVKGHSDQFENTLCDLYAKEKMREVDYMNAEVLCFGTEILHGDIANTNAQHISKKLAEIGINVFYHSVVGDNHKRMKEAFELAFSRADLVVCTGGLGPTQDDITKEILAEHNKVEMVYDEDSYNHVKNLYGRLNKEMPESNKRQAYFPKGSNILNNNNGTANGCLMDIDGKVAVLMPGPPREMFPMLEELVLPYLMKYSDGVIYGKKFIVTGLGESTAETMIMDLIEKQTNPTIATFAGKGRVVLRVTAKAPTKEDAAAIIKPVEEEIFKRMGENVYTAGSDNIAEHSAKLLLENQLTVAVAESCTGGEVSSKLIDFPGISSVFLEGFVTYSNEAKMRTLGVQEETLKTHGAVSAETAEEMAKGAALKAGSDIGLSTTGVAGPSGGTEKKPVGLVYIGVYYNGKTQVRKLSYPGLRATIRERSANSVLDLMNRVIRKSMN